LARRVSIEILGDAASAVRGFRSAGRAADSFGRDLKEVSISARKSADAQVQATIKKDGRLRQEIRSYREVAASAKRGSREQIAAANLAAASERRLAGSIGVSAREARRHAAAAGLSHREIGRGARGALAGSGAFRSFGRSIAFASSYFLGSYGAIYGLRATTNAASDLEEQAAKTEVVFGRSARGVARWAKTMATPFGISERSALTYSGTFGALFRPLGIGQRQSAGLSKKLVERAADLASFYNTTDEDALSALQSGLVGQVRPLRRFGVQLSADRLKAVAFATGIAKPDVNPRAVSAAEDRVAIAQVKLAEARQKHGVSSVEALQATDALHTAQDALHKSLAGSTSELTAQQKTLARYAIIMKDSTLAKGDAARSSGRLAQQEKQLHAQLSNQEDAIGKKLIPIELHYVKNLNNWLSKSGNQERVTRAVGQAVHALAAGVKIAAAITRTLANVATRVAHAVGGWQNAFKIVLAGLLIAKLVKVAAAIRDIQLAASGAAGARGVAGLLTNLGLLRALGPIAIAITAVMLIKKYGHIGGPRTDLDKELWPDKQDSLLPITPGLDASGRGVHGALRTNAARRAQLRASRAATRAAVTAEATKDRAAEARDRMKAAAAARLAATRQQAAQMRLLGLGPSGSALAPTKAALKRELGTVSQAIKGTFLDTGEHRSLLSKIRRLLSGQLGSLSAEVRAKVKELLDGLKGQMDAFDGFNLTKADKRRRFLDRRFADRYAGHSDHPGRGGQGQGGRGDTYHYSPVIHTTDPHEGIKAARRGHWQLRNA
jgi:hypothetical protein